MSERKKVHDYLIGRADNYKTKVSDDPDENECGACSMSETMHTNNPKNTCGRFVDGRTAEKDFESKDGDTTDGW